MPLFDRRSLQQNPWQNKLLLRISVLLSVVLLVVVWWGGTWINVLLEQEQLRHYEREVRLLGDSVRVPFLRGDYQDVEGNLLRWAEENDDIAYLQVTTDNHFLLVDYRRKRQADETDLHVFNAQAHLGERFLYTLEVTVDDMANHRKVMQAQLQVLGGLLLFLLLVAYAVWRTIQRVVVQPMDRQMAEQLEEIQRTSRAKNEFLATMSHELRTPLTVMLGNGEMLAESGLNMEQQQLLRSMSISGHSLLYLINDVLDLSKIEAGKFELNEVPFSVNHLIDEMSQIFPRRASDAGIIFKIEQRCEFSRQLVGDSQRIRQVVLNLLGNAVKFTTEGEVHFIVDHLPSMRKGGEQVLRLIVEDQGIGMSSEVVERLFRPFEQADSSISRRFGGTGLGLHISWNLVQLMGGEIRVESTEGRGSRFEVDLPLAVSKLEDLGEPGPQEIEESRDRFRGRVLVVEDTPELQLLERRMLEKMGVVAEIAIHGREAVEKGLAQPFDLILMDMQMPEMNGIKATEKLRAAGCNTPIVALTANVMQIHREKFKEAGCDGFLSKPIDRDQLQRVLSLYLQPAPMQAEVFYSTAPPQPAVGEMDSEVDAELFEVFLESTRRRQQSLISALAVEDWKELHAVAHAIKGSGRNFGYPALTTLGEQVCDLLDVDKVDVFLVTKAVEELDRALSEVK